MEVIERIAHGLPDSGAARISVAKWGLLRPLQPKTQARRKQAPILNWVQSPERFERVVG